MDEQGVIEKLSKIQLFDTVKDDEESLSKLARIVTWQQCKAGVEVIREGVEGDEAYILYKGVVKIHKRTPAQEPYTIVALRDDEDVFFGELALMDKEVRSASVTAETDCEFLVIHRDNFIQLGEKDPRLGHQGHCQGAVQETAQSESRHGFALRGIGGAGGGERRIGGRVVLV
jgi:CRP/FNR family cyclic AMP-dependent transcriptional regulator